MKTIATIIIAVLLAATAALAQHGSSVETYAGSLVGGTEKTFKVKAKKGQVVNAKITSDEGNVLIAEEEGATELTAEVIGDGYDLVIRNQGNRPERYELTIKVYTPEPEPAENVTPEEGNETRVYDLTMYPYKFKRRFSVALEKGSGARISIEPASSAERLSFTVVGADNGASPNASGFEFPFLIRADRDGTFVFELEKKDEVILEAKMTIEVLSEEEFQDPGK